MLQGIGSIIGPPMVGATYDAIGSFDTGFYIAGGFFVVATLCNIAAQAIHRRTKLQSDSKNENNPVSYNNPIEVTEETTLWIWLIADQSPKYKTFTFFCETRFYIYIYIQW